LFLFVYKFIKGKNKNPAILCKKTEKEQPNIAIKFYRFSIFCVFGARIDRETRLIKVIIIFVHKIGVLSILSLSNNSFDFINLFTTFGL